MVVKDPRLTWKGCKALAGQGVQRAKELATPGAVKTGLALTATSLPAVVLGMLLNVLDGVSYGVSPCSFALHSTNAPHR